MGYLCVENSAQPGISDRINDQNGKKKRRNPPRILRSQQQVFLKGVS